MSSYLNFYLVPKKKEGQEEEPKPLLFQSWSRNTSVYQAFDENLNIVYTGNEKVYTEITPSKVKGVIEYIEEDLKKVKKRLKETIKLFKDTAITSLEVYESYQNDCLSTQEYIEELEEQIADLQGILTWVSDLEYTDFEKALANIT